MTLKYLIIFAIDKKKCIFKFLINFLVFFIKNHVPN